MQLQQFLVEDKAGQIKYTVQCETGKEKKKKWKTINPSSAVNSGSNLFYIYPHYISPDRLLGFFSLFEQYRKYFFINYHYWAAI